MCILRNGELWFGEFESFRQLLLKYFDDSGLIFVNCFIVDFLLFCEWYDFDLLNFTMQLVKEWQAKVRV